MQTKIGLKGMNEHAIYEIVGAKRQRYVTGETLMVDHVI